MDNVARDENLIAYAIQPRHVIRIKGKGKI
jgi:hypothetical protein